MHIGMVDQGVSWYISSMAGTCRWAVHVVGCCWATAIDTVVLSVVIVHAAVIVVDVAVVIIHLAIVVIHVVVIVVYVVVSSTCRCADHIRTHGSR